MSILKTILIPIFVIQFALISCAHGIPYTPSPTTASGIEGYVTEGPMCPGPVQVGNNTCPDIPYQATISILDANHTKITQFQTDANGFFMLYLSPGTYILHPESSKPFPHAADQTVIVSKGQFTQVTIVYDTGMR